MSRFYKHVAPLGLKALSSPLPRFAVFNPRFGPYSHVAPPGLWRGGMSRFYKHAAPPGLKDFIVLLLIRAIR